MSAREAMKDRGMKWRFSPAQLADRDLCPHCALRHDGRIVSHCPDRDPWTNAEHDALRDLLRRRNPAIEFTRASSRI